jgi:predicted DNA-binding transcriptional regulator AlpA
MPREIEKGDRAWSQRAPDFHPAADLNGRERLLTPTETAKLLRLSASWLAKARMTGTGPPFIKLGRCVRYDEGALFQWMKSRLRRSTSQF